ncbi:DNA mismatch repair protein hexB [Spinellus fusiger]|nr:DNA mismatch repair protein hexB [Spinellus fusiger]
MSVPTIKRLDPTVVNRIAAGEIIHRPANALKELIENALDAGSTQIEIHIKDGGLKLLQIKDNGHGIHREDMAIVCERFTTSKLSTFEDLSKIATYGFRGEALASISHVAHVTITTKTADSPCAFRAHYSDGKLVSAKPGQDADPRPCSGTNGTQITAEDLFYSIPARRKALQEPGKEYSRIVDIVSRYAVHNTGVSFTCRKHGMNADVQTASSASLVDTIRQIYGATVASELLSVERAFESLAYRMKAYITNANYNVRKTTLLLFINHRAVESAPIKRMIEDVYSDLLPKGSHPFVYLSLEINPRNVDVNLHPTKRQVQFLNEDKIIKTLGDTLRELLESASHSRTFYNKLPMKDANSIELCEKKSVNKTAAYNNVRTDSKERTLDSFLYAAGASTPGPQRQSSGKDTTENEPKNTNIKRTRVEVRLKSVLDLRKQVQAVGHADLTRMFVNHTFVGCVDDMLALIQYETSMYLVNHTAISEALFYQVVLNEFCNFGTLHLDAPVIITDCIKMAMETEEAFNELPTHLNDKDVIAKTIKDILVSRAVMLKEYFEISISEEGHLHTLPMLLKDYTPALDKLPLFYYGLEQRWVDWENERQCFDGLAKELAILFCTEPPLSTNGQADLQEYERYQWQIQHIIFPSLKSHFTAPSHLTSQDSCIRKLASLADLYRVFERC